MIYLHKRIGIQPRLHTLSDLVESLLSQQVMALSMFKAITY